MTQADLCSMEENRIVQLAQKGDDAALELI